MKQAELSAKREAVTVGVLEHVERNDSLLVLKAPPGSGKTHTSTRAVALAAHRGRRIAVGTQTNAQADDFCRRMATEFPKFPVVRFASSERTPRPLGPSVKWAFTGVQIASGPGIVVAPTAKWAASDFKKIDPFDMLLIDEAWQMCWADFMLMSHVSSRFVLVGDPGQIAPVVPIDVSRWQTSRRPPHWPAPEVILRDLTIPKTTLELPVSTRLPYDTVEVIRAFYDFQFDAWALEGDRRIELGDATSDLKPGVDGAIDLLTTGSIAVLALPTPPDGPPDEDLEAARAAASVVSRLLERGAVARTETGSAPLQPEDIGVSATRRVMNTRIQDALGPLAQRVRVDTPERWQGLERKVMVAVHPLSGTTTPSSFDLSTGRLCVMASRHSVGLVVVSRDHVAQTLTALFTSAEQAIGLPDEVGRGRAQHLKFWNILHSKARIVHLAKTP